MNSSLEKRNMSQDVGQTELRAQTEQLLDGPLKHARAAALAAALLPLASVAVSTASAQTGLCASAGVSGRVWHDTNSDGVQDPVESGVEGAVLSITPIPSDPADPNWPMDVATDAYGFYFLWFQDGEYQIALQIPPGTQPSPANATDDAVDSDGVSDLRGHSVATVGVSSCRADFGVWTAPVAQPGTGTPGYWKNHPEAWPVDQITVGGVTYTKAQAIAWLNAVGKDKTITMFSSLVPAMLNVLVGNDASCVSSTIAAADSWMTTYGPVGKGVHAASLAWKVGEPLHRQMDNYNNGMLCAPHRD
jgi:hypothetical protein